MGTAVSKFLPDESVTLEDFVWFNPVGCMAPKDAVCLPSF